MARPGRSCYGRNGLAIATGGTVKTIAVGLAIGFTLCGALVVPVFAEPPPPANPASVPSDPPAHPGDAEFQLARKLQRGEGLPVDAPKSYELMRKAAELGHPEAMGGLGYYHAVGLVVPKNEEEAVRWFKEGAEQGSAKAMYNLGRMMVKGTGCPKDETAGMAWMEKAAAAGQPDACQYLGMALFFGDYGQDKDPEKAYPLLVVAARADMPKAQNTLGLMLSQGIGVKRDKPQAEIWLRKAAMAGDTKAQSQLGTLMEPLGKDPERGAEALAWLMLAVERDEVTAVKSLSSMRTKIDEGSEAKARAVVRKLKAEMAKRQAP